MPVYGDRPAFTCDIVSIQAVPVTGGIGFKVSCREKNLLFHDIDAAAEAFLINRHEEVNVNKRGPVKIDNVCVYEPVFGNMPVSVRKMTKLILNPPIVMKE